MIFILQILEQNSFLIIIEVINVNHLILIIVFLLIFVFIVLLIKLV